MEACQPTLADWPELSLRGTDDSASYSMTRVRTSGIEEQAASLRKWDQVYEQMTPGRFNGSLFEVCFRGVQIFRETTNQSVHETGAAWPGARAIGVPLHVGGNALFGGEVVQTDALITLGSDDELDFYTPCSFDILGLTVDERSLESYAARIEHCDVSDLFRGKRVLTTNQVRLDEFRRLLLSILHSVEANPVALQFQQTQRLLEQSLMTAIFNVLSDPCKASAPEAVCPSRCQIVERAKRYMSSHIDQPITVADLCVQLGVSRRTLQYSFQEVLGINALRLLRAMRLNGVRRDLKTTKPDPRSVQDIAARWGFWHLGHFVTDYKRMFGELPSHTLRGDSRMAPAWPT
jgi:AraC family ethanolamine operon transcriptional activator